ncbi:phage head closure protein [Clostridium formicaceticum]|uniref:Head-tail adaptor protein n=1 Tax=Clostridium formicaceticum TaxID=1497 RepID=A0AAC9RHJ1_9CLOT|nr:phage head closure protein [Clostridium formicaceticum]AOY76680.1 head-tail adaptor protein [Clostridium formicaceticum]ARE87111.1 Phage head-tail joining protein [Clostridium formicaceticum]
MNPGELRHRIEVWGKEQIETELEEMDFIDSKLKTIWASIIPQTGNLQKGQVETILTNTTHKIICRYSAAKDITSDMYIKFRGQRFDIKYILNPYFKNELLEIFVEQVIE